jgi:Leucine Rich repeat
LSHCDIHNAGAHAWSQALSTIPRGCLQHLDLSNNRMTDEGVQAMAQAMIERDDDDDSNGPILACLDLSHNTGIGNRGATALAEALTHGCIQSLILKSCQVHADGAAALGTALCKCAIQRQQNVHVDISGNPIGILRGKAKSDKGMYSASRLKSKASATAASYMSMFKKGLKDAGLDVSPLLGLSSAADGESDDDTAGMGSELRDEDVAKARCGAKALAGAFLDATTSGLPRRNKSKQLTEKPTYRLGLRRCFLDHGAADALAAMVLSASEDLGITLQLDVDMNTVLEDDMVQALQGNPHYDALLRDMAERYTDAMEALQESRVRALEAARAAEARYRAESEIESSWRNRNSQSAGRRMYSRDEPERDSDADYEDEEEEYE